MYSTVLSSEFTELLLCIVQYNTVLLSYNIPNASITVRSTPYKSSSYCMTVAQALL
jgi:hypothetical protein